MKSDARGVRLEADREGTLVHHETANGTASVWVDEPLDRVLFRIKEGMNAR